MSNVSGIDAINLAYAIGQGWMGRCKDCGGVILIAALPIPQPPGARLVVCDCRPGVVATRVYGDGGAGR